MVKKGICVIGVYYGTFPKYFDLWLKSAGMNDKIDFMLFTDAEIKSTPKNVKVIPMTLEKMKKLAEEKLELKVSLERPYKCCDFKVVYGKIFQDYISAYEYWGHCDFDLIWGDIYSFLVKNQYQQYDRFLNLGHFSLYRNTDEVNNYYMQDGSECGDYTEVFSQDKIFGFDEWQGLEKIYIKNNYSFYDKRLFADISQIYYRFRLALDDINYKYQVFYWKNGHVYRSYYDEGRIKTEEFIYVHFKKRPNFEIDENIKNSNGFYITSRGFVNIDGQELTKKVIQRVNPYRGRVWEYIEYCRFIFSGYKTTIMKRLRFRKG